jgi:hypothetical protein
MFTCPSSTIRTKSAAWRNVLQLLLAAFLGSPAISGPEAEQRTSYLRACHNTELQESDVCLKVIVHTARSLSKWSADLINLLLSTVGQRFTLLGYTIWFDSWQCTSFYSLAHTVSKDRRTSGDSYSRTIANRPKVRGFKPSRGRWIFKGDNNPQHVFLRRERKAVGAML